MKQQLTLLDVQECLNKLLYKFGPNVKKLQPINQAIENRYLLSFLT